MAEWIELPSEPLRYQPVQWAALDAHRQRECPQCHKLFRINESVLCTDCKIKGIRKWDRLTIFAGRRFGKSRIGSIIGAEEATLPRTVGWACAPTNPKLHRYVIPAFQRIIPREWVKNWNTEFWDLTLKNGSLIHFQTLEDPDQGRGDGLDWLWIDEICELTRKHWDVIRPTLAGDTFLINTTSPRGYDWVYEDFGVEAEKGTPGYCCLHARTSESANPRITPEFLAREKAQMSDTMYRQEYEADFVVFTGSIYGGYISDKHILRTQTQIKKLIPEWPDIAAWRQITVGLDTGADHPFGAAKAVSTEGGLVFVGEYLERDRSFVQHCSELKQLAQSSTTRWAINKNERQARIELSQHGIHCQPAENDQVAGVERVRSWLKCQQMFFVEERCPRLLNQMKAYRWAENSSPKDDQKRKEKVFKFNDELPDCVRYIAMTWPVMPKEPPKETEKPRDLSAFDPHTRATIERMNKIEKEMPLKKQEVTDDFWLS